MKKSKSWFINLSELKEATKQNIAEIKKSATYIFYPVFLLYAFTGIGLAKLIQIIFY